MSIVWYAALLLLVANGAAINGAVAGFRRARDAAERGAGALPRPSAG